MHWMVSCICATGHGSAYCAEGGANADPLDLRIVIVSTFSCAFIGHCRSMDPASRIPHHRMQNCEACRLVHTHLPSQPLRQDIH